MSGIQIENLVKTYGDNIAVNGLNLNLEKGKVYGFLGPNGAGKSTTMNTRGRWHCASNDGEGYFRS